MKLVWLLSGVFVLTFVMTGLLRRYALARNILDIPNARSSHVLPTPRGGGLAIVVGFLGALTLLALLFPAYERVACLFLGAGGLVALVGMADDHRGLSARWRLVTHFLAAAWVLLWLPQLPSLSVAGYPLLEGRWGYPLMALFLVWMLNLYNFMDGIDGLAGIEAVSVAFGGALLFMVTGRPDMVVTPLLLVVAALGFLCWNFPPARIFMGDTGSGFVGIALGGLALLAGAVDPALFWAWMILLGVFVVDASLTLLRRLLRGERIYEAHRSHAYQHAAIWLGRHRPVTIAVFLINVGALLPVALLVGKGVLNGVLGVLITYIPLLLLGLYFRAGNPQGWELIMMQTDKQTTHTGGRLNNHDS